MRNLTCIVCPMGCSLNVAQAADTPDLIITGNRCPRGAAYAQEEIRAPKRVVTATCCIESGVGAKMPANMPAKMSANIPRRVPVKTADPCPKEKIPALLEDIYKTKVSLPVRAGDTVIADWNGEGINIVATRTIT